MLAKFSGLNPTGQYISLEKEKPFFFVLTYSIRLACARLSDSILDQIFSIMIKVFDKAVFCPLLFNLYLNELPRILNNHVKDSVFRVPDGSHLNCYRCLA